MRPVNLIPSDERRGGAGTRTRTSPASYLLIGGLAAILVALVAVVLTNNSISDREARVAELEQEKSDLEAQAASLSTFASFRVLEQQRAMTVRSLAQSRFDWERVMRELAVVLPANVWLVGLTGTVKPDVTVQGGTNISARDGVAGPALEIVGCAAGHEDVARLVAGLEDIDGVTRVGLTISERPDSEQSTATGGGDSAGSTEDCRTRDFITRFEIVAAFDEVPTPEMGEVAPPGAPPAGPPPGDGVTPADSRQSAQDQVQAASNATNLVPGAGG